MAEYSINSSVSSYSYLFYDSISPERLDVKVSTTDGVTSGTAETSYVSPAYDVISTSLATKSVNSISATAVIYSTSRSTVTGEYTFNPYITSSYQATKSVKVSVSENFITASTAAMTYTKTSSYTYNLASLTRSSVSIYASTTLSAPTLKVSDWYSRLSTTIVDSISVITSMYIYIDSHYNCFSAASGNPDGVTASASVGCSVVSINASTTTDESGATTTTTTIGQMSVKSTLEITQSTSYSAKTASTFTLPSNTGSFITDTGYALSYNLSVYNTGSFSFPQIKYTSSIQGVEFTSYINSTSSTNSYLNTVTATASLSITRLTSNAIYSYVEYNSNFLLQASEGTSYTGLAETVTVYISKTSSVSTTYDSSVANLASMSSSSRCYSDDKQIYITTYGSSTFSHSLQEYLTSASFTKSSSTSKLIALDNLKVSSTYTGLDLYESTDANGYTYISTFYGTIRAGYNEAILKSDTSWVNVAQVSKTTYESRERKHLSFTSEIIEYNLSTFGVENYNISTNRIEKTLSKKSNNPRYSYKTSSQEFTVLNTKLSVDGARETTYNTTVYRKAYSTNITIQDFVADISVDIPGHDLYDSVTLQSLTYSSSYEYSYNNGTYSSSSYNTVNYGTSARVSDLISSSSWVNVFNTYLVSNIKYVYNVSSIWLYDRDSITETLSEYSTLLTTSFKCDYSTDIEYANILFTVSTSTIALATEDRFINRNGVSRYESDEIFYTNTVAYYNNLAMATLSQSSSSYTYSSETSVSRLAYTFISSTADFSSSESVITTETESNVRQQFKNSVSSVMNSTYEQQNDTLIFQSTVATLSTYYASTTYKTVASMQVDYEATTYTDEYNPVSYSTSSIKSTTSLNAALALSSTSSVVSVTQSIEYTPTYSDVDGIYVTN